MTSVSQDIARPNDAPEALSEPSRSRWPRPAVMRLIVAAGIIGAWELGGHTVFDRDFISPPSLILATFPRVLSDPDIVRALLQTFYELVVAFAVSVVIGVLIGVPIGMQRFALRTTLPIILFLYAIPQVTILPLFVLYFGVGPATKIAFGISHGIFPIVLNAIAGVQTVQKPHLLVGQSLGASRWQIFRRIILPHMTPSLFTGLRLGMSATLLGVILAELYVSTGGIGYYTQLFTQSFDPEATFALVTILALMAVVLNEIMRRAEIRAMFWQQTDR